MNCLLFLLPVFTAFPGTLPTHNPNTTPTIVIHGFDPDGASMEGVYGADVLEEQLLYDVADFAGLPVNDGSTTLPINVVATTTYYGTTPPSYYTAQDIAELDSITQLYGGGIPRYALIIAKYAEHIMARSGAEQVNIVSASMGSFVGRWMIEKDSGHLASSGKIARWLSLEGVLCGNWAASNEVVQDLWDDFGTPTIDTEQMQYAWVEANLHSPRREADNPLLKDILIGMEMSSRDTAGDGTLTDIMLLEGDFHANDGVVTVDDGYFETMTAQSQFMNRDSTHSWMHVNHYELKEYQPAMMQIANFLTQRRRATLTVTRLQVTNPDEPDDFWYDLMPAEVVIDSDVYSPLAQDVFGIVDPVCSRGYEGVSSPIYEYQEHGEEQTLNHLVFDDFIRDDEEELELDFGCYEIDWNEKYDVFEWFEDDSHLGATSFSVDVSSLGTTTQEFSTSNYNGTLTIEVIEYPFALLDDAIFGDIDGDGIVDVSDLLAVIAAWGPCEVCAEDLDGDGVVDVSDVLTLLENWG
ncbi:MAG: hypothetical protein QGI78_05715 [Phycisphaerales bacterium]|nr:hypothetical protein [Phycisphaerales bacterium]